MSKQVGKPVVEGVGWLQTDLATHEAWIKMSIKQPTASALVHFFCSRLKANQAMVVPLSVMADCLEVHRNTVRNALAHLEKHNWIQIINLGNGQASAYVLNARVAWQQGRGGLKYALFNATVMAAGKDQPIEPVLNETPLRQLPTLRSGEKQLPAGDGEAPPSQPQLDGVDLPDLPSIQGDWCDDDFPI